MTSLDQKLQSWIVQETNLVSEGRLKYIPDLSTLSRLNTGKNKRLWSYVIQHVRSRHAAEKIRRILKAKRNESEHDRDSIPKTCINDTNFLRQEITKLNEKCIFLKTSLSTTKDKILTTESTIRELRNDIDKTCQRTAFLEMMTLKYKEKNHTLNSLQNQVSFYLCNRFASGKVNKIPHSVILSNREDKDNLGLNYLLSEVLSLVLKKLSNSDDFVLSKEAVRKKIDQKLKIVSLSDLIRHLKDLSNISCINVLNNVASAVESEVSCEEKCSLSQKQLQNIKISQIRSVFTVRKIKREIENLVKHSKLEAKIKSMESSADLEFPNKQELFKMMEENEALNASIKSFEETLCKVHNDNQALQEKNKEQMLAIQGMENLMIKFFKDFDLLRDLLKSVPSTCHEIVKCLSFLHSYANEQVFLAMKPDLGEYSVRMDKDFQLRIEMFWSTCELNNIIQPSVRDFAPQVPDAVWNATNLSRFYNVSMIARQVKHVKELLRGHQEFEFQFKCEGVTSVEDQYNRMMDILNKMQSYLELSNKNFELCSDGSNKLRVSVKDWWEQGAQYIHKILCQDKTLKMWQDILIYLSDF